MSNTLVKVYDGIESHHQRHYQYYITKTEEETFRDAVIEFHSQLEMGRLHQRFVVAGHLHQNIESKNLSEHLANETTTNFGKTPKTKLNYQTTDFPTLNHSSMLQGSSFIIFISIIFLVLGVFLDLLYFTNTDF
ncbi:hypothetical protein ACB098_07G080000 [Castanea mollissima]